MIGTKAIGAIMVLIGCCYLGFSSAAGINSEIRNLRKLHRALDFMMCELQYKLTPLPELCNITAGESSGCIKRFFEALAKELESQLSPDVKSCMRVAISKTSGISQLTRNCLLQLGSNIGRFDLPGQINGLESARSTCIQYIQNLESGKESRLKTYKTLGICAGAAMVILFV